MNVAAVLLLCAGAAPAVPAEFQGWKTAAERTYDPETIFDYIDGAGEVYRSYRFRSLAARRLEREGKPALVVDLFDMGSPEDAFGVFTHDLDGEAQGIGQGSNYKGGLLSFWKDGWLVSVYAEEETVETRGAVMALGRRIAASIPGEGPPPALLALLPREGLEAGRVRAFPDHLVLRYHLPLFLALLVYTLTRNELLDQRDQVAVQQAFVNARLVRDTARVEALPPGDLVNQVRTEGGGFALPHVDDADRWFAGPFGPDPVVVPNDDLLPTDLKTEVLAGANGLDAKAWRLELPPPRFEQLIASNLDSPARELMWGSPGTLLAAVLLHEWPLEPRCTASSGTSPRCRRRSSTICWSRGARRRGRPVRCAKAPISVNVPAAMATPLFRANRRGFDEHGQAAANRCPVPAADLDSLLERQLRPLPRV